MGGVFAGIDPVRGDADASSVRLTGDGVCGMLKSGRGCEIRLIYT